MNTLPKAARPMKRRHSGETPVWPVSRKKYQAFALLFLLALAACQPTAAPAGETPLPSSTAPSAADDLLQDPAVMLGQAVETLQNTPSFHLNAHVVTAYEGTADSGERTSVYQEHIVDHGVIRQPVFKVHTCYQTRSDPQADYGVSNTYAYQEGGKYYVVDVNAAGLASKNEIGFSEIEPLSGGIYQTLIQYASQAQFVSQSDGLAQFSLDHPAWYTLPEAIRLAGMESLSGQVDSPQRLRDYAAENFPNARPVRFVIWVDVNQQVFTRVSVDDREFLLSLGEAQGSPLTDIKVMEGHTAEYLFDSYAQVEDFQVPQVPT